MIRKALFVMAAVGAMALAGCDLYFGPGGSVPPNCGPWGCSEPLPPPPSPFPGEECRSNYDCAAGCYCTPEGFCAEAGFCQVHEECPPGFMCDDRASCVPTGSVGQCSNDDECPYGMFCEPSSGSCLPSSTCWSDEECGPGFSCDDRGTCVPSPCKDNTDCAEGCYCDPETGTCLETGFCWRDSDCFDGMVCDDRNTCIPPNQEPPLPAEGSCGGPIECAVGAPKCPDGMTPVIADGCYTGDCMPREECDVPPLALCEKIQNENQCFNRPDCNPTYRGVNCTCDGAPCLCSDPNVSCTCESWEYTCESL